MAGSLAQVWVLGKRSGDSGGLGLGAVAVEGLSPGFQPSVTGTVHPLSLNVRAEVLRLSGGSQG